MLEKEIIKENAKKEGRWMPGLDSNRELFKESTEEFMKKIEVLKKMVDE